MVLDAVLVRSGRWKNCGGCKTTQSDVHFQSKSRKVVVDQFNSALQVLSCTKWEGAIINVKAIVFHMQ
jgi:hypothetical protein